MKKKNKKRKLIMFSAYSTKSKKHMEELSDDTKRLSMIPARYQVDFQYNCVYIFVRCYSKSKVYEFCKELGYSEDYI